MANEKRRQVFQKSITLSELQDAFGVNAGNRTKPGRWDVVIRGQDATLIRTGPLEDDPNP